MNETKKTFHPGQTVQTKIIRHVELWGKRWPVVVREIRKVVAVEPQGIVLDDSLYYAESWLTPVSS